MLSTSSTACSSQLILAKFEPIREAIRTLLVLYVCVCGPSVALLAYKLCTRTYVRTYVFMQYIRTLISLFLLWGVRLTLLFSMVTGIIFTPPWPHTPVRLPTPRRGGVRFGSAKELRADEAVPRRRSISFKAGNGGGGGRINTLGAPAVAKQTKPDDPMQVQVEPAVPIP